MKYTKIPETAFKNIQMNAGILVTGFNPSTGVAQGQLGATTGGINFNATPSFSDYGEDIDNCPKNTKELKKLDSWEVTMGGTFVTVNTATAKKLIAAADVSGNKVTPRNDVVAADFQDLWWIGDYSDENTGENAGYCAVHMMNALSTGGFQIQSTDKGKGNFAFTFTGHYSMNAQDTVPFEVYIKEGTSSSDPYISIDAHTLNLEVGDTYAFGVNVNPSDATITWSSSDGTKASVSNGTVTASAAGSTIITAAITESGVTYNDTCTVVVTAG